MAKVFLLCERAHILLQCVIVEFPKAGYYYTSCLPNLELLIPRFLHPTQQLELNTRLLCSLMMSNKTCHETLIMDQSVSCIIFEKIGLFLNTGALVSYRMACLLRFYVIVVRPISFHQDNPVRVSLIVKFTTLGFIVTGLLFTLTVDHQFAFSRAFLAPDEEPVPINFYAKIWFSLLFLADVVILILYGFIISKVLRTPTVSSMLRQVRCKRNCALSD